MKYLSVLDQYGRKIPINAATDYEGASVGRRMASWGTSLSGVNTSLSYNLSTLRSRSRELIRNNPLADGGIDDYVACVIGTGISPRWEIEDRNIKNELLDLWNQWVEEADVYGRLSFYGLQSLVLRGLMDAGESLIRFVRRYDNKGLSVPLQLQVLEADHLDETYEAVMENGNVVRMGIEIDDYGVPVAYWLYEEHPHEHFFNMKNIGRKRIPASEIIHVFKPLRAGQMRGRPWMSSVLLKLHDLDQYDDAELVRKKGAAMFGGFIYEDAPQSSDAVFGRMGELGSTTGTDSGYDEIVALEPGTFPKLPKGLKVEFSKPVDVGANYDSWMKKQLRDIAKGMRLTYEQLTGDLSDVNFSSIRAGINDLKRRVTQLQHEIIVYQFCRRVVNEWLNVVFLTKKLPYADYFRNPRKYRNVNWYADGWPSVNPEVDAAANLLEVRAGFTSRAAVVAAKGMDVESVDRENAADRLREKELGLVYQTNPEIVDGKGKIVPETQENKGEQNET